MNINVTKGGDIVGTAFIFGSFVDYDWQNGIKIIQKNAEETYGNDIYNGKENNVDFGFIGNFSDVVKSTRFVPFKETKRETPLSIREFINIRFEDLRKGNGEIVCFGVEGYNIISTEFYEERFLSQRQKDVKKRSKKPAVLVREGRNFTLSVIYEGTVAECKKKAHEYLRETKYRDDVYIVSAKKSWLCSCKRKFMKKTSRKTTEKTMVLPLYKYIYYGAAME